ncbi:MAG TPA: hypothetical protein VF532_16155 [Candidatus Angelobacter sp.]
MKKLTLGAVFALAFFATSAWASGRGHENDGSKINAESMSMIGLGAASAIGAGVYLARRARRRS